MPWRAHMVIGCEGAEVGGGEFQPPPCRLEVEPRIRGTYDRMLMISYILSVGSVEELEVPLSVNMKNAVEEKEAWQRCFVGPPVVDAATGPPTGSDAQLFHAKGAHETWQFRGVNELFLDVPISFLTGEDLQRGFLKHTTISLIILTAEDEDDDDDEDDEMAQDNVDPNDDFEDMHHVTFEMRWKWTIAMTIWKATMIYSLKNN
ncbi:hypothetical protein LXL04_014576 [Taraxacum kok-saghyz]